jgi:hypothetical protein
MKTKLIRGVLCATLTIPALALAQDEAPAAAPANPPMKQPSADSIKETWDYFYKGQGSGPVLVETKLCSEVAKEGPNKFECVTEVNPADGVKANTRGLLLWQAYLVPQGDAVEDLRVQVKQGNTVRETKDVKVSGTGWRARYWTGVSFNKPGTWSIVVLRAPQEGPEQVLKTIDVKVN